MQAHSAINKTPVAVMGNLELSETSPVCRLMLGAGVNVDEHHGEPDV